MSVSPIKGIVDDPIDVTPISDKKLTNLFKQINPDVTDSAKKTTSPIKNTDAENNKILNKMFKNIAVYIKRNYIHTTIYSIKSVIIHQLLFWPLMCILPFFFVADKCQTGINFIMNIIV